MYQLECLWLKAAANPTRSIFNSTQFIFLFIVKFRGRTAPGVDGFGGVVTSAGTRALSASSSGYQVCFQTGFPLGRLVAAAVPGITPMSRLAAETSETVNCKTVGVTEAATNGLLEFK